MRRSAVEDVELETAVTLAAAGTLAAADPRVQVAGGVAGRLVTTHHTDPGTGDLVLVDEQPAVGHEDPSERARVTRLAGRPAAPGHVGT